MVLHTRNVFFIVEGTQDWFGRSIIPNWFGRLIIPEKFSPFTWFSRFSFTRRVMRQNTISTATVPILGLRSIHIFMNLFCGNFRDHFLFSQGNPSERPIHQKSPSFSIIWLIHYLETFKIKLALSFKLYLDPLRGSTWQISAVH